MILLFLASALAQQAPAEPPQPVAAAFGAEARLDTEALDRETAREDVNQAAIAEQSTRVSNNSVNGTSATGQITLDGSAFQGISGLTIVNNNSGNNVAINAALNVNVHFIPGQ